MMNNKKAKGLVDYLHMILSTENIGDKFKRQIYIKNNTQDIKKRFDKHEKVTNVDGKFITFIMCLKNRSKRALLSINNLVNESSLKHCKFIIVEDKGENLLNLKDFKYSEHIDHYLVDTGVTWSRAKLLNYGIKRADTELVAMWDSDFLYHESFIDKLKRMCATINFNKNCLAINSFETDNSNIRGTKYKKFDPYGYLWVYSKNILHEVKGFHEMMKDHGWEERALQNKLKKKKVQTVYSYTLDKKMHVYHYSHDTDIRGKFGTNNNKKVESKKYDIWGEQKLIKKYNYKNEKGK
jgi:hypothetical protein